MISISFGASWIAPKLLLHTRWVKHFILCKWNQFVLSAEYGALLYVSYFQIPIAFQWTRNWMCGNIRKQYLNVARFLFNQAPLTVMIYATCFGGFDLCHTRKCFVFETTHHFYRCSVALPVYDEILSNKNDEQSKISFQAIEFMTTLYTNFAKYG